MSKSSPTPHEIERWVPHRLQDFLACEEVRNAFVDHLRADGDGTNILISGETGTGKTGLVEAYVRTRNCPYSAGPLLGPCGKCDDCKTFDFENQDDGIFARLRAKVLEQSAVATHFFHVNCYRLHEPGIRDLAREIAEEGADRSIVYLDEVHDLAEGKRDKLLLKPISELNAIWIATGITTDALSPMFVRRFATRCTTTRPTEESLALFLLDRCKEWKIALDCPETLVSLARRSRQIAAECISVLARAASQNGRVLDRQLVEGYPFITGVTR